MDIHVLPEFGEKFLGEIKRPELQRFFNRLLRKMKTSSVDKVKIVLSGVFNLAVADEVIATNPCRYVKLPTPEAPEKIALTYEQLARLYHHAKPELRVILQLCACAGGLRIGEACGTSRMQLTSDDVLHVRQQVLQLPRGRAYEDAENASDAS
jgi:integrase